MSDFEDKLNAILSNPDAMAQVMNLAQSLGGSGILGGAGGTQTQEQTQTQTQTQEQQPSSNAASQGGGKPFGDFDGLGNLFGQIDPNLISRLLPLLGELNQSESDERLQLLYALRPFLKPERRDKVERAVKAAKLIHLGKKFLTTLGEPYV